jgi:hypothetical protein
MADDIPQDPQLASTALMIVEKRDRLLAERTELREQREQLLARIRRVDREIADCRATARFFGLKIEFPEDPNEAAERELYLRRLREREIASTSLLRDQVAREAQRTLFAVPHHGAVVTSQSPASIQPPKTALAAPAPAVAAAPIPRPTVREVALAHLRVAGDKGAKAADIREYFERTYGQVVHEKTVGMTLYRLLQANQVRRDGHTWFFGPPSAETKNPGGETPGPNNVFS